MELSSLLHELHLCAPPTGVKPHPCPDLPPITELLSHLRQQLLDAAGESSDTNTLIGHVEQLFHTADPPWLFSPPPANDNAVQTEKEDWAELREAYQALVGALIGCAALPPCEDDCSPPTADVYQRVPGRAARVCSALQVLLESVGNWERGGGARGQLVRAVASQICVFAVTHFQVQAWTSSSSRQAAQSLQGALLKEGYWRDSAHMLTGVGGVEEDGILGGVLDVLQPQLTKDSWQRCESVKLVFAWTLLQVTHPALSSHLPRLLPPSLLLSDHYRPENCALGVRCLHHIVLNTPAAELRQFNRAEVLYQALFKHLYTREAAVTQLVLSCLLDLLLVLEKPPSSSIHRKPCRHDDVLRLVLTHMEAEQRLVLRRAYASVLPQYLDRMGVATCRHLQRLQRVLVGYLEINDPPEETTRLKILEALETTLRTAWPRMACRVNALLPCLLRLLVDTSSDHQLSDSVKEQLTTWTTRCIGLLNRCSQGKVQCLLQQVDGSCCSPEVLRCLETVTGR